MGAVKKAGVPFYVKIDTNKDLIGKPEGFKVQVIRDDTGEATDVDTTFHEIEKAIQPFSTTASADVALGSTKVPVTDASGFAEGDVVVINGNYYYINEVDTANNVITLAKPLVTAVTNGDAVEKSGKTGIYRAPITINEVGDYTLVVSNYKEGMQNVAFPVTIEEADVDDIQHMLNELKAEIDEIKAQVDTLDEEAVNNIVNQVNTVQSTLEYLRELVDDVTASLVLSGDNTDVIQKGDVVTGTSSAALGKVVSVAYDSTNDVTNIVLDSVKGEFATGETLKDQDGNETTGTVKSVTYGGGPVDSIMEFVKSLNEQLADGSTGLEALTKIGKDIEHLINGDSTLEDGSACPTAGKGLAAIFDELAATHSDVSAIKSLAEDTDYGFQAIKHAIADARASIEAKIDALIDETDENSLISKINAIKTVVDANHTLLSDAGYGLEALKNALDNLTAMFTDGGSIETRFDNLDSALNDVKNAIDSQTAYLDSKFGEVMDKLNSMQNERKFIAFV